MSQQPTSDNAAAASANSGAQTSKKDEAAQKMKAFGNKLQGFAKKAVDSTKKFVKETEEEIKMTESMSGLLSMAIAEFQLHIKKKADTTDKNKKTKEMADSFKNCVGVVFVASFNVAFTVGGSYGRGIVMRRLDNSGTNWSLPLAIQEIEGSLGWQLNVSRTKTFYVLKNDMAVKNFQQKENVKLGGKGFAAIGNLGIQAQGDVTASKESLTTTTNDAKDIAATNASVGSAKGVALGVNVNAGTFQPCKKINDATYNNFDIKSIFNKSINESQSAEGNGSSGNSNDKKPKDDDAKENENNVNNANGVKDESIIKQLEEFIQLMEGVIQMEKAQAKEEQKDAKEMKSIASDKNNGNNDNDNDNNNNGNDAASSPKVYGAPDNDNAPNASTN